METRLQLCQSCGRHLRATTQFGTNSDHTPNHDYCCFCYSEGAYTDNDDLESKITEIVKYHDENEYHNGRRYSMNEAELHMRIILPTLKRWRSHTQTHLEYYRSINRALEYINEHLSESINLSDVAEVAHISGYHFHRIFKAVISESVGDYIQRLRLEKAAFKLKYTTESLTDIAEQTGYQSQHALFKAFKKRYGISPIAYRKDPSILNIVAEPVFNISMEPEIKKLAPKEVVYLQIMNPLQNRENHTKVWDRVIQFADTMGIPDSEREYILLNKDLPTITNPEQCRFYACITALKSIIPMGKFGVQKIEGGKYAVFKYTGECGGIDRMYCNIYRYWIPQSQYKLRDSTTFEKLYMPNQIEAGKEQITEIYIPVE